MSLDSLMNIGTQGLQSSQQQITTAATDVARAATKPVEQIDPAQDLVRPLIEIKASENVFDASAKVVKVADEAVGTLLDIKA